MIVTLNSDWLKQIKLNSASWLSLCGQKHRDNSQNIFYVPQKKENHTGLKMQTLY